MNTRLKIFDRPKQYSRSVSGSEPRDRHRHRVVSESDRRPVRSHRGRSSGDSQSEGAHLRRRRSDLGRFCRSVLLSNRDPGQTKSLMSTGLLVEMWGADEGCWLDDFGGGIENTDLEEEGRMSPCLSCLSFSVYVYNQTFEEKKITRSQRNTNENTPFNLFPLAPDSWTFLFTTSTTLFS